MDYANIFYTRQLNSLPVEAETIRKETRKDNILSKVVMAVKTGSWKKDEQMLPFYKKRNELSICQECIIWGPRVIIPESLRNRILELLHEGHLGIVKIKRVARGFVWWPNIDKDIEKLVLKCKGCLLNRHQPHKVQLHTWPYVDSPWYRIHMDFAQKGNKHFLVIVDSYSKWPEVIPMTSTTTISLINVLTPVFARWGIPRQVVSDNGPQFTSYEFKHFLLKNGIEQKLSAPYHASSNGQAERYVQSFKNALDKMQFEHGTVEEKLAKFLLAYRNAPHALTNETPANLFLKRELRTKLHLIRPKVSDLVNKKKCNN